MHEAVRQYVRASLPSTYGEVIDVGSLDINGGVRDLLDPSAKYIGVDAQEGAGVDVVADFTTYTHSTPVDLILCLEVLEHTPKWREIVAAAARNLRPGGTLILTCATTGRYPHSAKSEAPMEPGEYYANVTRDDLADELGRHFGFNAPEVAGTDLRATAYIPYPWTVVVPSRSDSKIRELVGNLVYAQPEIRPDQIVIVSDGLSLRTRWHLRDVTIVKGRRPFVYPRAINMGADAVDADSDILILGDDVRLLNPGAVDRLSCLSTGMSAIAPAVIGLCGQPAQRAGSGHPVADWLAFICAYIPRAAWDAVGPLDERFIGYGYDDMDWCLRAKDFGPFAIDHGLTVTHTHTSDYRSRPGWEKLYEANLDRFREKWGDAGIGAYE